jgi:hypothetical protein
VRANGTPIPTKVSPPDLDRLIAGVTDKTTLEASVYISSGHPKWRLTSATFTWEFDLGTEKWNEVKSYNKTRTRAVSGHSAFGKWMVGDTDAKQILYIDSNAFDEVGIPSSSRSKAGQSCQLPEPNKGCAG